MRIFQNALLALACLSLCDVAQAQDSVGAPRPTPLTRPALKLWLEDVKQRQPRIPLPELTPEDRQALGEHSENYESRLRHHYLNGIEVQRHFLSPSAIRTGRGREQDPSFTLENGFKVELFWIVSRVNNCHYCIGHQESKLLGAGRSEDEIAALDGDWSDQPPKKQAAYRFAKRFTYQPHLLSDADIRELQPHYSDLQILEMILSMSGNNSINRWKEALAVPQRADEGGYSRMASLSGSGEIDPSLPRGSYLTPTSPTFATTYSLAVPINGRVDKQLGLAQTASQRPDLESSEWVLENLQTAATRESRLPLRDRDATIAILPQSAALADELPNWVRLLAHFPVAGASRLDSIVAAETGGDLSPMLKGQLAWIVARQDRAWYSAGQAMRQLRSLGLTESDVLKLDESWNNYSARERSLFQLARNLAASPVVLTSAEIADAVDQAGARDTVQAISYICSRASFNRLTEAAGLPLEQ